MGHVEKINQNSSMPFGEPVYEAPRVEVVVSVSELEREALYAGGGGGYGPGTGF